MRSGNDGLESPWSVWSGYSRVGLHIWSGSEEQSRPHRLNYG